MAPTARDKLDCGLRSKHEPLPGYGSGCGHRAPTRRSEGRSRAMAPQLNRDRGDHPPTGSVHAGRPADPSDRATPVARSPSTSSAWPTVAEPARRQAARGRLPQAPPQGDSATCRRSNGPRIGGRTSLNRSARARSPPARTWTTNAPLSCVAPECRGGVDQAEQACRLALGDQDRGDRQAGPARQVAGGPDGDRCHQPPVQPAGRVATLGWDGEGEAVSSTRIGSCPVAMPALCPPSSMSRSSRTSRCTSTVVGALDHLLEAGPTVQAAWRLSNTCRSGYEVTWRDQRPVGRGRPARLRRLVDLALQGRLVQP